MTFEIDPDEVKKASGKMLAHNQKINSDMNALMSQLEALPGGWKGPAGSKFTQAKLTWQQVSANNNKNLQAISDGLLESAKGTQAMDDQHVDELAKADSNIGAALRG